MHPVAREDAEQSAELVYLPTLDDIRAALRVRARVLARSRAWLRQTGIGVGVSVVGAAVFGWAVSLPVEGMATLVGLPVAGALTGWLVGSLVAWASRRRQARAVYRMAAAEGEYRMTIDGSGVRGAGAHTTVTVGWGPYPYFVETPDLFVVLGKDTRAVGYVIIPKRGVRSASDVDRLRDILDRHLVRTELVS
ncbi:hypothetical protein U9R90_12095 [Streptomyces sp. E11-3]|uniref:hypothetical protein n=1 Tax=Streptomyces sp. E11-3 TaxID=3110112 RepID=UPI00397F2344